MAQFVKWLRRRWIAVTAVAAVVLALSFTPTFWASPRNQSHPGEHITETSRGSHQYNWETEPVTCRELFKDIRTVGKLDYNEQRVAFITARVAGRVDKVHADFPGIAVKKDEHLLDIYSPDLIVTAQNLINAKQSENAGLQRIAQDRLLLWGIREDQIKEILRTGQATTHLTIYAPIGGIIIEKNVREQQYVKEGDMLYRIADLDPLWLYLDIYESDLAWVRFGQSVDVRLEAYPEDDKEKEASRQATIDRGTVVFIDPYLDDKTRTVKVRVNLKNTRGRLKPAMYASAVIHVRLRSDGSPEATGLEGKYFCQMHPDVVRDAPGKCPVCSMQLVRVPDFISSERSTEKANTDSVKHEHAGHDHAAKDQTAHQGHVLSIPATAVLDTGRRKIAYRKTTAGAYELVELKLGPRAEGKDAAGKVISYYPVRSGLESDDEVVVQGGFLLDSQRQIEGLPSLLYPEGRSAASLHAGHGGHGFGASSTAKPAPGGHQH